MSAREEQVQRELENAAGNLALIRGSVMGALMLPDVLARISEVAPTRVAGIDPNTGHVKLERGGVEYVVRVDRLDGLVP